MQMYAECLGGDYVVESRSLGGKQGVFQLVVGVEREKSNRPAVQNVVHLILRHCLEYTNLFKNKIRNHDKVRRIMRHSK